MNYKCWELLSCYELVLKTRSEFPLYDLCSSSTEDKTARPGAGKGWELRKLSLEVTDNLISSVHCMKQVFHGKDCNYCVIKDHNIK